MRVKYKNVHKLPLVKKFVENALEFLDIDTLEDATIRIKFTKTPDGIEAECEGDLTDVFIDVNETMPFLKMLRALSHELIHARQFLSGELSEDMTVWKEDGVDYSETEYEDQPWEIEAHEFEDILFMKSFPWDDHVRL